MKTTLDDERSLQICGQPNICAGLAGIGKRGDHGAPACSVDIGHSPVTPLLTP